MRQDRVGAPCEEHFQSVVPRYQGDQHAGTDEWRRHLDAASHALIEHLPQSLEPGAGARRQVQASNETGTWWPQWVQTQTCPRRTTCRPSSSRTD
jgi:hypothetical protein